MNKNTETLLDDNGFELLVSYAYERTRDYYEEPENSATLVQGMVYTELTAVEIVIAGRGIDLLPLLHENEKEFIIDKLQYED